VLLNETCEKRVEKHRWKFFEASDRPLTAYKRGVAPCHAGPGRHLPSTRQLWVNASRCNQHRERERESCVKGIVHTKMRML